MKREPFITGVKVFDIGEGRCSGLVTAVLRLVGVNCASL